MSEVHLSKLKTAEAARTFDYPERPSNLHVDNQSAESLSLPDCLLAVLSRVATREHIGNDENKFLRFFCSPKRKSFFPFAWINFASQISFLFFALESDKIINVIRKVLQMFAHES
jgi:hypothetical protein